MKLILRTLLFLLFSLSINSITHAQQSVTLDTDSLFVWSASCPTPVNGVIYVSGDCDNYNSLTDSIDITIFWGDGTSDTTTVNLYEGGVTDYYWTGAIWHTYSFAGVFYPFVVATAPNGIADSAQMTDSLYITTNCVIIDGYTYNDLNSNCTLETSDDSLNYTGVYVHDQNNDFVSAGWSSGNGYFSFSLPTGLNNLTVSASNFSGHAQTCPTGGTYTINSNSSQSLNFGFECFTNSYDKRNWSNAYVAPPGDTGWVWSYTWAARCDTTGPILDTLTMELDSMVSYIGMQYGPAPNVVSGSTLTWHYPFTQYSGWWNAYYYFGTNVSVMMWSIRTTFGIGVPL